MSKQPGKEKSGLPRLGKLPPQYRFFLNHYEEYRFSSCPICHAKMRQKKLPLVIHVEPMHLIALNKTCRYCPTCDLLIAHQNDIESLLAALFLERAPDDLGNDYLVIGTMDRSDWREGIRTQTLGDTVAHLHDFRAHVTVTVTPGGWYPAEPRAPHRESTSGAETNGQR